jgi:hypothetical protein
MPAGVGAGDHEDETMSSRRALQAQLEAAAQRQRRSGRTTIAAPIGTGGAAPRAPAEGKMQGTRDRRYASYKWKMLRASIIAERKRCEGPCRGHGAAAYLDHRLEVRDDTSDANFFDPANLQVLCASCHGVKSAAERARRSGKPYRAPPQLSRPDPTGLPTNPAHWWNDPDWGKRK